MNRMHYALRKQKKMKSRNCDIFSNSDTVSKDAAVLLNQAEHEDIVGT